MVFGGKGKGRGHAAQTLRRRPFAHFHIAVFTGAFVYASVGAGLGSVIDAGGRPDFGILLKPAVLLPILGLALLALLPVVVRRFRRTDPA